MVRPSNETIVDRQEAKPFIIVKRYMIMELKNITITATIEGDPVMVVLDSDQRAARPNCCCDKSGPVEW